MLGELSAVAVKALTRDKSKRYPRAGALADEINAFMSGGRIAACEYRQRLYVLQEGAERTESISRIFELHDPDSVIGLHERPSRCTLTAKNVVVERHRMLTWDRGFDEAGNQVWGSRNGPYVFVRR